MTGAIEILLEFFMQILTCNGALKETSKLQNSSVTVSFFTSGGGGRNVKEVTLHRPGDSAIHEHVDMSILFSTLPIPLILQLLASLLLESKVILCAKSLSLLSSCCHALISLMYPFTWQEKGTSQDVDVKNQHTYIPVLPTNLIDMVCLPSPFLIGVLPNSIEDMTDLPMEEVVVVSLEDGNILKQFDHGEMKYLPKQTALKNALDEIMQVSNKSGELGRPELDARNHVITEVFVHSYMELIGHFEDHYSLNEDNEPVITEKGTSQDVDVKNQGKDFYKASNNKEQKKFLKLFMNTQAFQQFVINRKINGPSQGLFENRFIEWKKSRFDGVKSNIKDILGGFKRKLRL